MKPRFLKPLPDTLELIGKLDTLAHDYRESTAYQMLLEAELFDCRERCAELYRVVDKLDHAVLRELDDVNAGYGIAGFFIRLVLLRQRLDAKGNSGPRPRTISRDFEILCVVETARQCGASYEEAREAAAAEYGCTTDNVKDALKRARKHPHNPWRNPSS